MTEPSDIRMKPCQAFGRVGKRSSQVNPKHPPGSARRRDRPCASFRRPATCSFIDGSTVGPGLCNAEVVALFVNLPIVPPSFGAT
jgi:hypothetical protein